MGLLSPSGRIPAVDTVRVDTVWVVVPCNDEAELVGGCLASVCAARARLLAVRPQLDVRLVLVLDACTDDSAAVAATAPDVATVRVTHRSVGRARAAGVEWLRRAGGEEPGRTWVACTDADSAVPADWLTTHVALADAGADLLLGTVEPDAAGLDRAGLAEWHRRHPVGGPHERVHGANLGVRLGAYDRVGGFAPLTHDEDVALVTRLRALRDVVVATTHRAPVRTSSRRSGRAPAGFAGYVAELEGGLAASP
ncbi:glycosyltransferase family 2 protein [Nocardioidaceae bacterium]|nr:glycosyltransferase family 2 protein [Nocardioidaceae bacterium]